MEAKRAFQAQASDHLLGPGRSAERSAPLHATTHREAANGSHTQGRNSSRLVELHRSRSSMCLTFPQTNGGPHR